ncbi:MAG: polyprenyl synthetase family protein [Anaerolineae bacterium]|nr:polyprenyl synthetase family protein [Anaerolineae bacterium]
MTVQLATERYLSALEAEMQALFVPALPELGDFYGYLRYHLGWADEHLQPAQAKSGKRLRPIFCLLAYEACGRSDWERALPAAAAVELLHNFSLIHDDIEDNDATRRGRPTLWALWGIPQAINAGDAMYALTQLTLLRLSERAVPDHITVHAATLLNQTCLQLTEGQFLDIRFETASRVPIATYLQMIERKTASLLAASGELGAWIAEGAPAQRSGMCNFGRHLGLAFQIQDDILGIWGDPQVTGKPVGSDLLRRKKTMPILHALSQSDSLSSLLQQQELSPADIQRAMALLEKTGSRDWTQAQAEEQTALALQALDSSPLIDPAATHLRELALRLLNRSQ